MTAKQTFKIEGDIYSICYFTGVIMECTTRVKTRTSISGGGGQIYNGTGSVDPTTISTSSTRYDTFFITDSKGKEMSFELVNSDIQARKGHVLTMFWPQQQGKDGYNKPVIAAYNHSIDRYVLIAYGIDSIVKTKTVEFYRQISLVAVGSWVIIGAGFALYAYDKFRSTLFSFGLWSLPIILGLLMGSSLYKNTIADRYSLVSSALSSLLKEIKNENQRA